MSVNWLVKIPFTEFTFEVSRGSGPGGQHVNRTNSAVTLRWSPESSVAMDFQQKELLAQKLATRLTKERELLIRSDVHRDQDANRKECLVRLNELLNRALMIQKRRVATKPTRASQRKRVAAKRQRSDQKKTRSRVGTDEWS